MIFNQAEGFDDDLSLYDFMKSNGAIGGSPVSYKVTGMEDVTFRLSTLKNTLRDNEAFRDHYHAVAESLLTETIRESSKLIVNNLIVEEEVVEEVVETKSNGLPH